ncbi:MAG: metalloregulator ArsR/SmtB family transcription factor, partial [Pseudomonadota bacterium]
SCNRAGDVHVERMYSLRAEIFKALSHPIRLKIVECVSREEKTVGEIVKYVDGEASNVSRHLAVLRKAGILSDRKEGLNIYYQLEIPCVMDFFTCVNKVVKTRLELNRELLKMI